MSIEAVLNEYQNLADNLKGYAIMSLAIACGFSKLHMFGHSYLWGKQAGLYGAVGCGLEWKLRDIKCTQNAHTPQPITPHHELKTTQNPQKNKP